MLHLLSYRCPKDRRILTATAARPAVISSFSLLIAPLPPISPSRMKNCGRTHGGGAGLRGMGWASQILAHNSRMRLFRSVAHAHFHSRSLNLGIHFINPSTFFCCCLATRVHFFFSKRKKHEDQPNTKLDGIREVSLMPSYVRAHVPL